MRSIFTESGLPAVLLVLLLAAPVRASVTVLTSNQAGTEQPAVMGDYTVLPSAHVDLNVTYHAGAGLFGLGFRHELTARQFAGAEALAHAPASARVMVPAGAQWSFLGPEGSTFWSFPLAQVTSNGRRVLYLGWSAYGVAPGIFAGNAVAVRLQAVRNLTLPGSGRYFAYTTSSQQPVLAFGSRPGDPAEIVLPAGGHTHYNQAFTAPGLYRLDFVVSGVLAANGLRVESPPLPVYFGVEQWQIPQPGAEAYAVWRADSFGKDGGGDDAIAGPAADPDRDGVPNRLEYALGLDPRRSDAAGLPRAVRVVVSGAVHAGLEFRWRADVPGVLPEVQTSTPGVSGGAWRAGPDLLVEHGAPVPVPGEPGMVRRTFRTVAPLAPGRPTLLRLRVTGP